MDSLKRVYYAMNFIGKYSCENSLWKWEKKAENENLMFVLMTKDIGSPEIVEDLDKKRQIGFYFFAIFFA